MPPWDQTQWLGLGSLRARAKANHHPTRHALTSSTSGQPTAIMAWAIPGLSGCCISWVLGWRDLSRGDYPFSSPLPIGPTLLEFCFP